MPRNRNRLAVAIAAAGLAGGGAGAGAVALTHDGSHTTTVAAAPAAGVANVAQAATLTGGQVAKAATGAVVEVDATQAGGGSPFPGGSQSGGTAQGTGFVYDAKGDIVTNQHVVDGATSVSVKFADGSTYKATVVGTDATTDLAVVH